MNLNKTQCNILELTSAALFSHRPKLTDNINWEQLYQEALQQAVFPLMYSAVRNDVPPELQELWSDSFYQLVATNLCVNYEHMEMHTLMENANIPYVILKGAASAKYYPEPELRIMGDVDFLVHQNNINKADSILKSVGFVPHEEHEHEAHIAYSRTDSAEWELHWQLAGIPQGEEGDKLREAMSDMIETGYMGQYGMLPDDFHHGLILLVHTAVHLTNTGIGLRHLCDWAVFVNKVDNFEIIFKEVLQSCGLWRFAQLLTQLSTKYLHLPIQKWAMESVNEKLLDAMICDIFVGGNFGTKDSERINQAKLMTDKSTGQIDGKSMAGKLVSVMNEKARAALPVCRKSNLLLPVGWVYAGGRHLIRIKQGKRPEIHVNRMFEGAKERREIYKQFHLYESSN